MLYDFDGTKYRHASRHQREWGTGLLSKTELSGTEKVLDLGCGDGSLSLTIAQRVPHGSVLGVDASAGMISAAQSIAQDNLSFRLCDIDAIDFDGEFDLVFSNAALHWVHNHEALLENSYRALRRGGCIAWNFAGSGTCPAFISVVRRKMTDPEYAPFFAHFLWPWYMPTHEEYQDLLGRSRFRHISIEEEVFDRSFSKKELINWIDQPTIVPFLAQLPNESTRSAFRDSVVREMLDQTLHSDGTHHEQFVRLNVRGEKQSGLASG